MFVTLSALKSFPDQLEAIFNYVPINYRNWSPQKWDGIPSEKMTAIEQICHVRDVEIQGYQVRFRRMLEEETPVLKPLDGYALVEEHQYSKADPDEVIAEIRAARTETLEIIESLTPQQLLRTGRSEGYGPLTVKAYIHYLCSHDQQHLSGLQWLLGKIESDMSSTKV